MKNLFLVCLISMCFACSCSNSSNTAKVITADVLASALTTAANTALGPCTNASIMQTDITTAVNKWFSINQATPTTTTEKGIVQNLCQTAISSIVPNLIGNTVPATWGCKLTTLDNVAGILATAACANITI